MEDIGLVIGTGIFMVFGLFFAFGLPKLIRQSDGATEDSILISKWLRWLGLSLIILSLLAVIAIQLLPKEPG